MHPLPIGAARWTKGFWAEKFELTRATVIPKMKEALENPENAAFLGNFGAPEGGHRGTDWSDGDCYKWLEACARVYALTRDEKLDQELDRWIDAIAKRQAEDGYIGTQVQLDPGKKRWGARRQHELYNMGHLLTAACVHNRATGKDSFLNVARKAADYLHGLFGPKPAELAHFGWNPSQIIGLVDIYRVTGEKKYLELAETFVGMRGSAPWPETTDDPDPGDQNQDRVALRKETEAVGHAVTGAYLWCGTADLYAETGEKILLEALERIWADVTEKKMYVTGGIGALHEGVSGRGDKVHEAFGKPHELPNAAAYNETCASIANAMWNWRMLNLTGEAKYADVMERVLYNSALSGMSLDGTKFFYTNPLARDPGQEMLSNDSAERWSAWKCYCCPPQVARTLASSSEWAYGISDDGIWVHLYGSSALETDLPGGGRVKLAQETDYPWDGKIKISIQEAPGPAFSLMLRLPGWAESAAIRVNGKKPVARIRPGAYTPLTRKWKAGDEIELELPLKPKLVAAGGQVTENRNRVAVTRGPVVYCLESQDLPDGVGIDEVGLPLSFLLSAHRDPGPLGGVTVLKGTAQGSAGPVPVSLIPYYAWLNRGPGSMRVWLPLKA